MPIDVGWRSYPPKERERTRIEKALNRLNSAYSKDAALVVWKLVKRANKTLKYSSSGPVVGNIFNVRLGKPKGFIEFDTANIHTPDDDVFFLNANLASWESVYYVWSLTEVLVREWKFDVI